MDIDRARPPMREERLRLVLSFGAQTLLVVSALALNFLVAAWWNVEARGDLAVVMITASLSAYVGCRGIGEIAVWSEANQVDDQTQEAWIRWSHPTVAVAGITGAGVGIAFVNVSWADAVLIVVLAFSLHAIRIGSSKLLGGRRYVAFEGWRIAQAAVPLAAIVVARLLHRTPVVAYCFGLGLVAAAFRLSRAFPATFGHRKTPSSHARIIGRQATAGNLAMNALTRLDVLVVAAILPRSDAGLYAIAIGFVEALGFASQVVSYRALRNAVDKDPTGIPHMRLCLWITGGSILVGTGAIILLPTFIADVDPTKLLLTYSFVAPGALVLSWLRPHLASRIGGGMAHDLIVWVLVATAAGAVADLLLLQVFPVYAAALVSTLCYGAVALRARGGTMRVLAQDI